MGVDVRLQTEEGKDLVRPADNSLQTVNMGAGTVSLGKVRTTEAHATAGSPHSTQGIPEVTVQVSFIENRCH